MSNAVHIKLGLTGGILELYVSIKMNPKRPLPAIVARNVPVGGGPGRGSYQHAPTRLKHQHRSQAAQDTQYQNI